MYDELYELIEENLRGFNATWEDALDSAVETLENKYLDEISDASNELMNDFEAGIYSMSIAKDNRKESYIKRPVTRADEILMAMGDEPMTAREIMIKMGFSDMNMVRPRLTELAKRGLVQSQERNVTIWIKS